MLYYKIANISDFSIEDISKTKELLSATQLSYIESLCDKRKEQSLAVRTALNLLIIENNLDLSINSLEFSDRKTPCFNKKDYFVTLSHSGNYVACAISSDPIGIDIEKIKPIKEALVKRVCNKQEQDYIAKNGIDSFFTIWTLKEAYIKSHGFDVDLLTDILTVDNGIININNCNFLIGEITNYKWSIIEKQR